MTERYSNTTTSDPGLPNGGTAWRKVRHRQANRLTTEQGIAYLTFLAYARTLNTPTNQRRNHP